MTDSIKKLAEAGVKIPEILLPARGIDLAKWSVIACDQFTSQPEYWQSVRETVGESPSALKITLPEIYLEDAEARVPEINREMKKYLDSGVFSEPINGFVLVERKISDGFRRGLIISLDLEAYDFSENSVSPIRATEGTIASRLPPRVKIRKDAPLELPHILVLIDDPEKTVIEPLFGKTELFRKLYDFDLMLGGGHITGYGITDDKMIAEIAESLSRLNDIGVQRKKYAINGDFSRLTFAVGDGNHSLATAKSVWESIKLSLPREEWDSHPARYPIVELNNLHDGSLKFEPIHRILTGVEPSDVLRALKGWCKAQNGCFSHKLCYVSAEISGEAALENAPHSLSVGALQLFLDDYAREHETAEIDYIHDDGALLELSKKSGSIGFFCDAIEKSAFFGSIIQNGALPRKTFSIGSAKDKRYYLECAKIR